MVHEVNRLLRWLRLFGRLKLEAWRCVPSSPGSASPLKRITDRCNAPTAIPIPETTKAVLWTAEGCYMNTPEWLKPGLYGAAIGAVLLAGIGFNWGGWVTGGTARDRAMSLAHDDVVAALVPVCLDMALTDPDRAAHLATIRAATSFRQRDALMDTGWATMPGSADPDRDIAKLCLERLELDVS